MNTILHAAGNTVVHATGIAVLPITAIVTSFAALRDDLKLRRLFQEDEGVEGCGFFARNPENPLHILGNVLKVLVALAFAPIYLITPRFVVKAVTNWFSIGWQIEFASTPDAVLTTAPAGDGKGKYEVTGYKPEWILEVTIKDEKLADIKQIEFSKRTISEYTALSYPMKSAYKLFMEASKLKPLDPPPSEIKEFTDADRKRVSERFLMEYCSAHRTEGNPDRIEYVWLDEWCLVEDVSQDETHVQDEESIEQQRKIELGKIADIYSGAATVAVFCHQCDCDHQSIQKESPPGTEPIKIRDEKDDRDAKNEGCIWGSRIWTIAEILNAKRISVLTRRQTESGVKTYLTSLQAETFRGGMMTNAARAEKWHLHAIMQHSIKLGSVPWQVAIHALVVEAIRRNEVNGHRNKLLGKALNGLLPRRARLCDLKGKDGWADLAYLLELNQGFYNAASLAAVCSLGGDESPGHHWLGPPIQPVAGNERLEPIVTAFPVGEAPFPPPSVVKKKHERRANGASFTSPLTIIGSKTVGLRPSLKRDGGGLYHNEEMKGIKILAWCLVAVLVFIGLYQSISQASTTGLIIIYATCVLYCALELMVGTMYLQRHGWVFLYTAQWGEDPGERLGEQDSNLRTLINWGDRQLVPKWRYPIGHRWSKGTLVDLRNKIFTEVLVVGRPNAMTTLAIHGSGVTCMLLEHPDDPTELAQKVGMANLPTYILAQAFGRATVFVS